MSELNQQDQINPYAATSTELRSELSGTESKLASRGSRFGAALIDGLLLGGIGFVIFFFYFGSFSQIHQAAQSPSIILKLAFALFGVVLYFIINGKFLADNGQTLGKFFLSIKIVRSDGSKASLGHIMGRRYLPFVIIQNIPVVGIFLSLIDPLFIFRDTHQCLHDTIADTIVIEAN